MSERGDPVQEADWGRLLGEAAAQRKEAEEAKDWAETAQPREATIEELDKLKNEFAEVMRKYGPSADPSQWSKPGPEFTFSQNQVLRVRYTNWRGEVAIRHIVPLPYPPEFKSTDFHPTPTWILRVWDVDKHAMRSYDLTKIEFRW